MEERGGETFQSFVLHFPKILSPGQKDEDEEAFLACIGGHTFWWGFFFARCISKRIERKKETFPPPPLLSFPSIFLCVPFFAFSFCFCFAFSLVVQSHSLPTTGTADPAYMD